MKHYLILLFFFINTELYSQIDFTIENSNKTTYSIGDTIIVRVKVKVDPHTCTDGMSRTRNFLSGLTLIHKQEWSEVSKGVWVNRFCLVTTSNKKGLGMFTISRRTDRDNLVKSVSFQYLQQGKN